MSDTPHTIWHSAARFFSGTMLSRISGMLRDMAMAYAFGTQSAVAALLVAFRFAHLLRRLLGEGAMQTALIPHFEELRKDSPQKAGQFFCDLVVSLTRVLTLLILITMAGLAGMLAFDLLSPGNAEIAWLTFCIMPSLLFICLFGVNASLLQCEKSYFISSVAPVAFNLFWIIGIFCTAHLEISNAMSSMALFIIIACLAQWLITLPKTYEYLAIYGRQSLWKGTQAYSAAVKALAKPLALGLIGIGAAQINNALDAVFARWADGEGPAFLWYAIRLQQLPLALFGIAISGALLPPLTRAIKANLFSQFQLFLTFALQRSLLLMIPMSALLFVLGDHCVAFVYGRGDFTIHSILGTTLSLWGYTIGLIPMALVLIIAPAFYAKNDYRTPAQASAACMTLNIGLNTLMVAGFDLGAASIAFATSVSAWFNLAWLVVTLIKKEPLLCLWRPLSRSTLIISAASCAAAVVVMFCEQLFWGHATALEILQGRIPYYALSIGSETLHLIIGTSIFGAVFGGVMLFNRDFLRNCQDYSVSLD